METGADLAVLKVLGNLTGAYARREGCKKKVARVCVRSVENENYKN